MAAEGDKSPKFDIEDFLDPYGNTSSISEGTSWVINLTALVGRVEDYLERLVLDPSVEFAIEDIIPVEEFEMALATGLGPTLIVATANSARKALSEDGQNKPYSPVPDSFDIRTIFPNIVISDRAQSVARGALNTSLEGNARIDEDESLEPLNAEDQTGAFMTIVLFTLVKAALLKQQRGR